MLEIDYLHGAELEQELTQLLTSYRHPHVLENGEQVNAEQFAELERKSASAETSLSKAFGHHDDWNLDFLKRTEPGSFAEALSNLQRWAQLIQWPDGIRNGRFTANAENSQQLKELISTGLPDATWPFVKIARLDHMETATYRVGSHHTFLTGFISRLRSLKLVSFSQIYLVSIIYLLCIDI